MAKNLLIVESPAKARTIEKYLGKNFQVLASYGHVRDLKPKEGAVDPAHDFAMTWELVERNQKHVNAIAKAAGQADAIYLATDLDREGEAISWHISEILKDRGLPESKRMHRVVFSEITPKAIQAAVAQPRVLSQNLINAQQARRALDYLVGFNLSPVLWRKVQPGLSAGRVQSPALRMITEREEAIEAFVPREYWRVQAQLRHARGHFNARLTRLNGRKFGQFDLVTEQAAMTVRQVLKEAAGDTLCVSEISAKERRRRPAPPFNTSTLQQEAARKLGFSTSRTMKVAQSLYEGVALDKGHNVGLITYMRTDATALSQEAVSELRTLIDRDYGAQALPAAPQVYKTRSKNAQEAHEAIRPTSVMRTPSGITGFVNDDQRKLYNLIWKRTVACQMIHATLRTVAADFALPSASGGDAAFRATGTTVVNPGFLAVYEEGHDHQQADDDQGRQLPPLEKGEQVPLENIQADQHFTEPPSRYSEASLVKTLEEYGIGRPSTYTMIIQVLLNRNYVMLDNRRFKPTDVGRAVSQFLSQHFDRYVDYEFTARLEDELDAVSRGEEAWVPLLERFWQPFKQQVDRKTASVDRGQASGARELGRDPKTGKPVCVRLGRFGPYAAIGDKDTDDKLQFASLCPGQSMHTLTLEQALELFRLPRILGHAENGEEVSVGMGRFGPFVKQGRVYASLRAGDDPHTISLADALQRMTDKLTLLANRVIVDFGDGLQVLNGRYGPYISNGVLNVRIPKQDDPGSLTRDQCLERLAKAPDKKGRSRKKAAVKKTAAKKTATRKTTTEKKTSPGKTSPEPTVRHKSD